MKVEAAPAPAKAAAKPEKARVIVEVPADAKVFVDDKVTKTEGAERIFSTPELDGSRDYYYVVRAEVTRDGKPVTETQRLVVRAGEEARASFKNLGSAAVHTASK